MKRKQLSTRHDNRCCDRMTQELALSKLEPQELLQRKNQSRCDSRVTELTKTREPLPVIVPLEFLEEGRFEPSIKRFRGRLEKWKCLSQADRVGVEDKISLCFVGCQEHIALARTQPCRNDIGGVVVASPQQCCCDTAAAAAILQQLGGCLGRRNRCRNQSDEVGEE